MRNYPEAERTLADIIQRKRKVNDKQIDAFEIAVRQKYGFVLCELGKDQEAREIEAPLLRMCVNGYGAGGITTLFVWRNLSSILLRLGDRERFFAVGNEILPAQLARPKGFSSREILALYVVGLSYKKAADLITASKIFRRVIKESMTSRRCFIVLCRSIMLVLFQIPIGLLLIRMGLSSGGRILKDAHNESVDVDYGGIERADD